MARCGCAGATCNCVVTAGANVTVTGAGTPGNPYIVSANDNAVDVMDTTSINLTLTPGSPDIISGVVILDPAAGNLITLTANGLRVDCATITATCAIGVAVADTDTTDMTLGPGNLITTDVRVDSTTPGNLITVIPGGAPGGLRVDCSDVILCFDAGLGISPASLATGLIQVCLSSDGGNALSFGADGCLYSPLIPPAAITVTDTNTVDLTLTGSDIMADVIIDPDADNLIDPAATNGLLAKVNTDCGLIGSGTLANPLRANVVALFPFPCTVANGGGVYCDAATGQLHSDPPHFQVNGAVTSPIINATTPTTALATPGAGPTNVGIPININVVNPSPCRSMILRYNVGLDHMFIGNPPGGGASQNDFQIETFVNTIPVLVQGHQHWRMSGQVASDRFTFDTTQAMGPVNTLVIPPGGVQNLIVTAQATNLTANGTPANLDGVRMGMNFWGNTI